MSSLRQQDGQILIGVLITMVFFMAVALSVAEFATTHFTNTRRTLAALNALSVAEAGADNYMYNLNLNSAYTPPSGQQTFMQNAGVPTLSRLTYETFVSTQAAPVPSCGTATLPNEKIVCVTGRIFLPTSSNSAFVTRKVKLTIEGSNSGLYALQSGPGGLIMKNSATIATGAVAVNGKITMSNSASIGTTSIPDQVTAVGTSCTSSGDTTPPPGDTTYPQICPAANPTFKSINFSNSAKIYGVVHINGNHDVNDPSKVVGSIVKDNPSAVALPADPRSDTKSTITTSSTATLQSCRGSETRNWDNLHITGGDVTVENNCTVTISGNVWIDGGLIFKNSAVTKVADGLSAMPTVLVDGASGLQLKNSAAVAANNLGVGLEFVTYYCGAGCSVDTANLTGKALYDSQNTTTIDLANSSLGAGSIFYARWSKVRLLNSGTVGTLIGQTVELDNSGNISFSSSGGPGSTVWDIRQYQQIFN